MLSKIRKALKLVRLLGFIQPIYFFVQRWRRAQEVVALRIRGVAPHCFVARPAPTGMYFGRHLEKATSRFPCGARLN